MSELLFEPAATPDEVPKKKKKFLSTIVSIFSVLMIIACIVWFFFGQWIRDYISSANFEPSPEMANVIEKVGFTWRGNLIARATHPAFETAETFNGNCPDDGENISTLGCYMPSENRVHIYDIRSDELDGVKESVLAHEVLHAIYARLNDIDLSNLNPELDSFYKSHKDSFGDYMDTYDEDQYYTELHSIIGQRVHYKDLSEPLQKHYAKYFSNQDAVVDFYDKYHDVIDELSEQIDAGKAEIDKLYAELQTMRTNYRTRLDEYNKDVEYHNSQVAQGIYSETRYQSLKKREAELDVELKGLNDFIEDYNIKARAYNELIERQQQLYGTMNSKNEIKTEKTE